MITAASSIANQVKAYCARIGVDPLLVQGAGGNVSWEDDGILWVKASGKWLSNAEKEEIFIPVNLIHLQDALAKQDFSVKPEMTGSSGLRPSIETLLHALMSHRVVVHLHAVEILAHLVRANARQIIEELIGDVVKWVFVDYFKPGADLALAIDDTLNKYPSIDVIFLKNHGVVIGGENIIDIHQRLCEITERLMTVPVIKESDFDTIFNLPKIISDQYVAVTDPCLHQLALNPILYSRLSHSWALYPDHVVFLGPAAYCYESASKFANEASHSGLYPELIFLQGEGVFTKDSFTKAKEIQLRCYFDVVVRQAADVSLNSLTENQITELLLWDAEKYRKNLGL